VASYGTIGQTGLLPRGNSQIDDCRLLTLLRCSPFCRNQPKVLTHQYLSLHFFCRSLSRPPNTRAIAPAAFTATKALRKLSPLRAGWCSSGDALRVAGTTHSRPLRGVGIGVKRRPGNSTPGPTKYRTQVGRQGDGFPGCEGRDFAFASASVTCLRFVRVVNPYGITGFVDAG